MRLRRLVKVLPLAAVALVLVAGCGGDDGGGGSKGGDELVFGTASDPVVLDGALVSDGESLRALDQMFEGLVTLKEGSTEVVPGLAESWESSADGTSWTFKLREGVKFHDGTDFNADAVCFNFDRWYNFKGPFQSRERDLLLADGLRRLLQTRTEARAASTRAARRSTTTTVRINLTKPSASFLGALALTNFTFASPKALQEYGADKGSVDEETGFQPTGTYGTEHPTGTGPFKFESWTRGDKLVMVRNDDYWGDKAKLDELIFRPIADNAARLQALQNGEIQGYDLVEPQDIQTIEGDDSLQILDRPAFNVGYVTINQKVSRRSTSSRCGRPSRTASTARPSSTTSTPAAARWRRSSCRRRCLGYADDVQKYTYDPAKAKSLLQKAGVHAAAEVDFWYPTDVSRPYMPDPKRNFEAFAASLDKSGFKVVPHSAPWSPDYLGRGRRRARPAL